MQRHSSRPPLLVCPLGGGSPGSEAGESAAGWQPPAAAQDCRLWVLEGKSACQQLCSPFCQATDKQGLCPPSRGTQQNLMTFCDILQNMYASQPKSTVGTVAYIAPEVSAPAAL